MRAQLRVRVAVVVSFVAVSAVVACGDDGDEAPPPEQAAGAGPDEPRQCGELVCNPVLLPGDLPTVEACCASNGQCGLNGEPLAEFGVVFDEPCQARAQPGVLDPDCEPSPEIEVPNLGMAQFDGCCTEGGRCGYLLNDVRGLIVLGLGCVDSTPFLDGGMAAECTP